MFSAFLSFSQIDKNYLPLLINNDLLEYNDKTRTYKTTAKGKDLLNKYKKLEI